MADPISFVASVPAISRVAYESAKSLEQTVRYCRDRDETLRRLEDELHDLMEVLESLARASVTEEPPLELLLGPVARCSQTCHDFKQTMEVFSTKSTTTVRDWTRMKYMGGDINEFIETIVGYKSTILIGLCSTNMRTSNVSHQILEDYVEIVKDTGYDLELRLQRIDEKIMRLRAEQTAKDWSENTGLEEERTVTQQGIRICDETRSYLQGLSNDGFFSPHDASHGTRQEGRHEAQIQLRQALNDAQDRFARTSNHLSRHLQTLVESGSARNDLEHSSNAKVSGRSLDEDDMISHRNAMSSVKGSSSNEAYHPLLQSSQGSGAVATQINAPTWHSRRSSTVKGEEDTDNNANRSNNGPRTAKLIGKLSDETLQHLVNASTKMVAQPKVAPPNADISGQEALLLIDPVVVDPVLPKPEDDSSDDTESIFSSDSITSSVTSVGISFLTDEVVHKFVDALFCTEELLIFHQSAIEDSAIGVARFTRNVRRMVSNFGRAMKIEFHGAEPSVFAKVLQSRNVSDRAARRIVHMNNREVAAPVHSAHSIDAGLTRQYPTSTERPESVVSAPERDDSSDASTDASADEQLKDDPRIEEMYSARETLRSSQAYQDFKARLLDFAHIPYEDRIRSIIEEAFATEECLPKDAVRSLSRELSWVPTQLFTFCNNRKLGILENLKACVFYKSNIEYWQWWPSQLVRHSTRNGDIRLSWHTPCGNPRSIDLPNRLVLPLQDVFSTAPMFQETCQPMHTIAHTAKPFHTAASSFGLTNMHASNGNVSPSQPPSGPFRQGHDLSTTPLQSQQSAAANAAALSSDTRSNNDRSANHGHIYLCIKSGKSYQFSTLEAHSLMSDVRLFSGIKKEYLLARKGFMHWFSIWRYSHCDFFQFSRFAMGAAPLNVGFPLASDTEYDFQPRPISPQPPFGPISKIEFRERFYTYCEDCCHRWHQQQMKRWLPAFQDVDAIKLMPKRTVALEMQDGKRGLFWGLLVREERRDEIVLLYACLVNLPGIIFFFLWLFDWGHAADLQNASVPFLTSLSLTVGFVGWLFQSSRDDV